MTIESIQSITLDAATSFVAKPAIPTADFGQWLAHQVSDVNTQINSSEVQLANLATGDSGNLHGVMLELEKSKLAFELTLQIRNKVLEGYQDIMRMQI